MARYQSDRNFGFGKRMGYAGRNALRDAYQGHYATVAAHAGRWGQFADWCRQQGVRDARFITLEVVQAYGRDLAGQVQAGRMAVAYAQNLLSSVNVTLATLRGDNQVRVSPAALVGERTTVRASAPSSLDRAAVARAAGELRAAGHDRAAAVLELARDMGLRIKEAALLDARAALKEACRRGAVNVTEGTKGGRGREVDRWVPVTPEALQSLQRAATAQGEGRNLIPPAHNWKQFSNHLHAVTAPVLARQGLATLHDCRAGYACGRYQTLTGHPAPAVAGRREADQAADRQARAVLAQELGHGRIDVLAEYVGSSR